MTWKCSVCELRLRLHDVVGEAVLEPGRLEREHLDRETPQRVEVTVLTRPEDAGKVAAVQQHVRARPS